MAKISKEVRSFTFRIDQKVYDALEAIAQREDRSVGYILNRAAEAYLSITKRKRAKLDEPTQQAEGL